MWVQVEENPSKVPAVGWVMTMRLVRQDDAAADLDVGRLGEHVLRTARPVVVPPPPAGVVSRHRSGVVGPAVASVSSLSEPQATRIGTAAPAMASPLSIVRRLGADADVVSGAVSPSVRASRVVVCRSAIVCSSVSDVMPRTSVEALDITWVQV